jgi:hypothetical protein
LWGSGLIDFDDAICEKSMTGLYACANAGWPTGTTPVQFRNSNIDRFKICD